VAADNPKALATREANDLAVVKRADDRLRRKNAAIMDYQSAACDLNDDGSHVEKAHDPVTGRPPGWSPRKYRVARDSRLPEREQPGYLARATRVYESYQREKKEKDAPPPLNVTSVTIYVGSAEARARVEQEPRYRVIDVEPDDSAK